MDSSSAAPHRAAALAISLTATAWYWQVCGVGTDDALIYFRMARHVGAGLGPVFNAGDADGGGTSLAWVYALAATARVSGVADLPLLAKGLATFFTFGTCLLLSSSFRESLGGAALLAPFAVVSMPFYRALPGLEIPLVLAAVGFVLWSHFSLRSLPVTAAALAFSFFCRGDAILLAVPILCHFLYESSGSWRSSENLGRLVRAGCVFCIVLVVGFTCQYLATDQLLPSTMQAKSIQGAEGPWPLYADGVSSYTRAALGGSWWLGPFALLGLLASRSAGCVLVAAAGLHWLGYRLLSIADYPWYAWLLQLSVRLLTLFGVATATWLAAMALRQLADGRGLALPRLATRPAALALLGVGLGAGAWLLLGPPKPQPFEPNGAMLDTGYFRAYHRVAELLCAEPSPNGSPKTLLAEEIGSLGYFCPEAEVRDVNGVVSPGLTRENLNDWSHWIDRFDPDYLVMRGDSHGELFAPGGEARDGPRYRRSRIVDEADFIAISVYRRSRGDTGYAPPRGR